MNHLSQQITLFADRPYCYLTMTDFEGSWNTQWYSICLSVYWQSISVSCLPNRWSGLYSPWTEKKKIYQTRAGKGLWFKKTGYTFMLPYNAATFMRWKRFEPMFSTFLKAAIQPDMKVKNQFLTFSKPPPPGSTGVKLRLTKLCERFCAPIKIYFWGL